MADGSPLWRITLGLSAAALSALLIRRVVSAPLPSRIRDVANLFGVTGGPVLVLLENGRLLSARRRLFPPTPRQQFLFTPIATAPGDGPEDFSTGRLSLAPVGDAFALSILEILPDGFDARIAVWRADTGDALFHGTDNTIAPATVWRGDDPAAPPWLLADQQLLDDQWQQDLADDPLAERTILSGRFDDVSTDGEAWPAGWTATGALRVSGRTRSAINDGRNGYEGELEPWWAIIGPDPAGNWGIRESGHGAIPAAWPAVPQPASALDVAIVGDALTVDGLAQDDPLLDAAVIDVAGPFS